MLGFRFLCFILVSSIVVTWASWFSRHRFKLEVEDFIFHILQKNFPNFAMKILLFSARSLRSFYFSSFRSQLIYTCSKHGVVQKLIKKFPKRIYIFSFSIHKWYTIVQTNRNNKTSIQIFQRRAFLQIKLL